ncbi:hypothetical protein ACFP51_25895 [Streptomyces pratens]|uniref:Uncharacterized protein n=1 Tax=Streptomyces pratens TaxID=887456 RepID=A0ABW1M9S9_9ACTN
MATGSGGREERQDHEDRQDDADDEHHRSDRGVVPEHQRRRPGREGAAGDPRPMVRREDVKYLSVSETVSWTQAATTARGASSRADRRRTDEPARRIRRWRTAA